MSQIGARRGVKPGPEQRGMAAVLRVPAPNPGSARSWRTRIMSYAASFVLVALSPVTQGAAAQTFSQVLQLGSDIGARLTHGVTEDRIQRRLFGRFGGTASLINATSGSPTVYQFGTDPMWSRLVFSKKDDWIREFRNATGPGATLNGPSDVAVSGSQHVFVADPYNGRVLVASFDGNSLNPLTSIAAGLQHPAALAWDGGTSPLTAINLYVVEQYLSRVSRWYPYGGTWVAEWTYGTKGNGSGQFLYPSGVCVGHTPGSQSGSSVFTVDFYVADRGNQRIVWLRRTGSGVTWMGSRSLPEGWEPVSCTVDHFGNLYVADRKNSQLVKYTWNLEEITRYGSYGTGATNYNTFAHPHDVHIPFGKKTVNGQTVWYGEGRILTAEDWGPNSGALEHWLGVEIEDPVAWGGGFSSSVTFRLTDHARTWVKVYAGTHVPGDAYYRTLMSGEVRAPGLQSVEWDGTNAAGQPAPEGSYHFHVSAISAYGCEGQGYCDHSVGTNSFDWVPCEDPESIECNPPEWNVALALDGDVLVDALPPRYRLGQVLTSYAGPLLRMEGVAGAAGASATMSGAEAVASVRTRGIRALAVDIPRDSEGTRVTVRLYSLTGRLVRVLADEVVDPGSYVVGWDGMDAAGRAAQPGVYVAVMTAGGFRAVQRLLLK